jgi:hypothetical protein
VPIAAEQSTSIARVTVAGTAARSWDVSVRRSCWRRHCCRSRPTQ